ncbi:hypothetical protein [Acinetobacter calcoaceticus]|uniref:hypothetical protein n=1 Tax=Acinetobacter calcoaceticus TaxID=471 RepID=UPI0018DCD599|nr:hypothetical protein [Acinetobacter calcoaceticus]
MKYLVFLILICMLFFIKNAATSLLIYGFFAADRDGYSFLEFFSTLYPNFKLYSRSLFFVLFVYSIIYLFLKIRKLTKEEFVKIFLALIISFLIVFNSLLKDNDIIWALSVLVFNGIPVYVIWYIMGLRYNNDYKFLGYISLKTILATAVLLIPVLAFLDGSLYKATEGLFVNEVSDVNLSLPTGDSIKGAYSRYSIYHNPNSLGFHSVIGILIGIYFLVFKKRILKIFGLFLIGCGCIGWLNSLTRGPMIFLILGFCYIALLNIFYGKRQNFEIKILLLCLC